MKSINPADDTVVKQYEPYDAERIEAKVAAAQAAMRGPWRTTSMAGRAAVLRRAAGTLRERRRELAELMAVEMGKPVKQGEAEADKCAWVCDYYAEHAAAMLADEVLAGGAARNYVSYRPLGIVLAVMPWNFPLWQVFRCAAPSLMAGNAVLLKHASNVPGSALEIERIFQTAGIPEGTFGTLLVGSAGVAPLIEDARVSAVSLTGSTPAGRAVAAAAGGALKPCVLELGGSDPYVVLADADPERAAEVCVAGRMLNNGQSCIAAKRFVVVDDVRAAFTEAVLRRMRAYSMGSPLDPDTKLGPMARVDLRDELHDQVERSVAAGASLRLGGEVPAKTGAWYPATLLCDVRSGMPAYHEELFGPVASILPAADEGEALRIANDSDFGLGACVLTADTARGERIARDELEAGACFVNDFVRSDPRLPFGGIKTSGFGRELGRLGIHEFVNAKTVCVYD